MSDSLKRLGRGKHWLIGKYVKVRLRFWDSPDPLGEDGPPTPGRYIHQDHLFPVRQHSSGPLIGFKMDTGETAYVSRNIGFFSELRRYAQFKWTGGQP